MVEGKPLFCRNPLLFCYSISNVKWISHRSRENTVRGNSPIDLIVLPSAPLSDLYFEIMLVVGTNCIHRIRMIIILGLKIIYNIFEVAKMLALE